MREREFWRMLPREFWRIAKAEERRREYEHMRLVSILNHLRPLIGADQIEVDDAEVEAKDEPDNWDRIQRLRAKRDRQRTHS